MANPRGRDRADEATTKHEKLLSAFVDASRSGDLDALMNMLAADARLVADGGGKVQAALNVIEGAERISRFIVGVAPRVGRHDVTLPPRQWAAGPGRACSPDGSVQTVAFEIEDDRIRTIYSVRNPDKLRHLTSA